jgi:Kef-type K+ transport system membrane component KefB
VLALTAASVALPLAGGAALGVIMHGPLAPATDRVHLCAFVAVAMSITALPILGRILVDVGLARTRLGSVTISAAALNDVVGWVLLATVVALASETFSGRSLAWQAAGIAVFGVACWYGVRPLLRAWIARDRARGDAFSMDFASFLTLVAFLAGVATIKLGVFAIFGGFAVGVLLFQDRDFVEGWHRRVGPFIGFFFLPIFFTYTGLRTDAGSLDDPGLWLWCGLVVVVAAATKCLGAYGAARWCGLPPAESRAVAVMMNTRGLMELVVLNVGFELGVIPPAVFTMLVVMAVATTVVTTPLLRRFYRIP